MSNSASAHFPSHVCGTGLLVCLLSMRCSHMGGVSERSVGIHLVMLNLAMSITASYPRCPSCLCHVSNKGAAWASRPYSAQGCVPLSMYSPCSFQVPVTSVFPVVLCMIHPAFSNTQANPSLVRCPTDIRCSVPCGANKVSH